ncbi:acetyl esterase/lipase [Paenibacillus taihuensis]|uniref:Acetyl esterase/lipase n=1 Tax=Paenibacillus taihuensis TaxID=1156355 RepID=A0A3D9SD06_9BACL|nr:alpha/beta hydrolase [Paenibacillus taihuensis]REE92768.1 acetyl esterase/lipase [Paenibacillus taihuensis]
MDEKYLSLVEALSTKAVISERDGYSFVVKPIPDSEARGELDPRVYEVQVKTAEKFAGGSPFQIDPTDMLGFAAAMRSFMGWDNDDVTDGTIATVQRSIESGEDGVQIPIRIYTPQGEAKRPAIVFFHGGGFIGGTLDVVENPCKCLSAYADAVVVSVDYRLAPEHPFPAGLNDCFAAVRWVHENAEALGVNPEQIAVAGDSAGGNMAAVCSLMDRDQGTGFIRFQALIYPTVNMGALDSGDPPWTVEAYDIRKHHEFIMPGLMAMKGDASSPILNMYLQGKAEPSNPYLAPLLGDVTGLPEALIITAEYDFLRLEDEAYARKLARSGVKTTLIQYNGVDHAFMDKSGLYPQAEDCMKEIGAAFRRVIE